MPHQALHLFHIGHVGSVGVGGIIIVHRVEHLVDVADAEPRLHAAAGGEVLPVLALVPVVQKEDAVPLEALVVAEPVLVPEVVRDGLHIPLPVPGVEPLFQGLLALHGLAEGHQHDIDMQLLLRPVYVLPQILFFLVREHIRIVVYPLHRLALGALFRARCTNIITMQAAARTAIPRNQKRK